MTVKDTVQHKMCFDTALTISVQRLLSVCVVRVEQNVGKSMSSPKFVSNLDGMNDGENFSKELLKVRNVALLFVFLEKKSLCHIELF